MRPAVSLAAITGALSIGLTPAAGAAAPKELYGKTVGVTWTETREQRPEGEQAWRQVSGSTTFNIYVSEAGRVFNNIAYSTRAGSAERKGEIAGSGGRSVTFNGRSLLILFASGSGRATRITADFDGAFSSCTAQVIRATEAPGTIVRQFSGIIKRYNEIRSTQIGGVSCSIRSGNVFADTDASSRAPAMHSGKR
jgi:hypothetical protein